jgi:hypothetical protein
MTSVLRIGLAALFVIASTGACTSMQTSSQTQNNEDLATRIAALEDRAAIKQLVDRFSVLADVKKTQEQTLLFTNDGTVSTTVNGQVVSSLRGHEQIGNAFAAFLANFDTVYHANAQLELTLNGDTAAGISYCLVTLIGVENAKRMKTSMLVIYNDSYVRQGGTWLIADRKSNFVTREQEEVR